MAWVCAEQKQDAECCRGQLIHIRLPLRQSSQIGELQAGLVK